jgi:hypothetical protein
MDPLLREDFESLLADHGGPCVSLFLPTCRAGAETRQGPIRLRNLLRAAQERLLGRGFLPAEAGAFLALAKDLVEDEHFWQHSADGVAIFCSADFFHAYHLPIHVKERVVVGRRFAIKPLLPLTSGDELFGLRFEKEDRKVAEERFRELMGTGKTSGSLAEVVPAARGGRVDVLFVAGDEANAPNATDEELLEAAACFTLRNGGTTYEVHAAEMPGGGPVAAVFRY